jgi:hypothetical protein
VARDESKYDTGKLAAMRAMEIEWGWHYERGERRPSGEYLKKEEAAAIADYALKFEKFPPSGISKDQRRHIREKYQIPTHIVP